VPVNFHLTADEATYIIRDSDSRVLFADDATIDRAMIAAEATGSLDLVITWGEQVPKGALSWSEWLATGNPEHPPMDVEPLPNLLYTSGTTGLPKGTELPPTMFVGGSDMAAHLDALKANPMAPLGTHLVVGPMYHTGPLSGMRLLVAGVSSVIRDRFDAEATLAAIDKYKTASAVMVPTHFVRMLALPEDVRAKYDISSMKAIAHTGAKCPIDVKRKMIEWFGPVFRDAYGASEVGTTCSISSEEWLEHQGSVGRAIPPFTALVLDDDNNELPPNTEGRLYFRDATGRGVIYPNDAEKTAAAHIAPGVFTLGEIAYMDEEGYVYLTDRFSDMVVSGGANIYPAEAEHVLIEHPDVGDVACIGVPHADMGESLKALVIPTDAANPPDGAQLITWCRERLSAYKCPRSVDIVDTVGRNTMGKINKRKLRAPYWE
jgi:long-chain acyl-CoA synthetase